jgi:hypothetical protein
MSITAARPYGIAFLQTYGALGPAIPTHALADDYVPGCLVGT